MRFTLELAVLLGDLLLRGVESRLEIMEEGALVGELERWNFALSRGKRVAPPLGGTCMVARSRATQTQRGPLVAVEEGVTGKRRQRKEARTKKTQCVRDAFFDGDVFASTEASLRRCVGCGERR